MGEDGEVVVEVVGGYVWVELGGEYIGMWEERG